MGRAGGGGGVRSGGSHSSSRSGGSHRIGSSSRPRSSSSSRPRSSSQSRSYSSPSRSYSSPSRSSSYYRNRTRTHYPSTGGFGGFGGPVPYSPRRRRRTLVDVLAALLLCFCIITLIRQALIPTSSLLGTNTKSTIEREKINSGLSYDTDVILVDETGWVEYPDMAGRELRKFWELTGVQPYVIMLTYDEAYNTDAEREAYTSELYDTYVEREDALLFVYFGEKDLEGDVGLMTYLLGKQAAAVFDGEAVDIFFSNIDYYWLTDSTMTDVYIKSFNKTASTIMQKQTNFWDFSKVGIICLAVVASLVLLVRTVKIKAERKREEAEETERILSSSLKTLSESSADSDSLLDKYK